MSVFLGQRSSLRALRHWFPSLVRALHKYYIAVRPLKDVRAGITACHLRPLACRLVRYRRLRGLPVLVHEVSSRAGVYDYAGSAFTPTIVLPSAIRTTSAPRLRIFEAQYPARLCPCLRFNRHLAMAPAKLGVRMVRYSFPVPLLHRRLHAGLSRRTRTLRSGDVRIPPFCLSTSITPKVESSGFMIPVEVCRISFPVV
jgi:hypothetical protein